MAVNGDFMHVVAEATDTPFWPPPKPEYVLELERMREAMERDIEADTREARKAAIILEGRRWDGMPSHRWPPPGRVVEGGDWHE